MRALIQRVSRAKVTVEDCVVGKIGSGIVLFLGVHKSDTKMEVKRTVDKVIGLRIFEDEEGKMNLSFLDVGGEILVVSQFTLYGDTQKGRRPSFVEAAPPHLAEELYLDFISALEKEGIKPQTGQFQEMMEVELVNSGPATFLVEFNHTSS